MPECYLDTCLIEVLLQAGKDLANHQKGNGTVAGQMREAFDESFCIGIIDEDRKPLHYLKEFDLLTGKSNLKLWKHDSLHHYIIQFCPVIEKWIMGECVANEISLGTFGLPTDMKRLVKITKSIGSRTDQRFVQLFKSMIRQECESLMRLKNWIEHLKQHKYKADINELING